MVDTLCTSGLIKVTCLCGCKTAFEVDNIDVGFNFLESLDSDTTDCYYEVRLLHPVPDYGPRGWVSPSCTSRQDRVSQGFKIYGRFTATGGSTAAFAFSKLTPRAASGWFRSWPGPDGMHFALRNLGSGVGASV